MHEITDNKRSKAVLLMQHRNFPTDLGDDTSNLLLFGYFVHDICFLKIREIGTFRFFAAFQLKNRSRSD